MSHRSIVAVSVTLCVGILASEQRPCRASGGPTPVLNPKTYTSPSGEFQLHVDPSTMYGQGKGAYRLTRKGAEVWSGEHPFTLWDAAVTDDGVVAGYAYSYGWRGFLPEPRDLSRGDFHVVIFDRTGKLRLNEITKREWSHFLHTPPNPLALGILVDKENDRFVVRVRDEDVNRNSESWWVYQLSSGKSLERVEPKEFMEDSESARVSTDARPIPDTPLILTHWWLWTSEAGARFTLVDPQGKPVWSLDLPGDYEIPGDREAESRLSRSIRENGAILRSDVPGRFELRFVADKKRVTFEVKRAPGSKTGWRVREVARADYDPPPTANETPVELPPIRLKPVGRITLSSKAEKTHPVRAVRDFDFDGRGRIGFVRRAGDGSYTFVLVTPDGKLVREAPLPDIGGGKHLFPEVACVGGSRWIVTFNMYGKGVKAKAWSVDVATARVEPVRSLNCESVGPIAGTGDGGFVALASCGDGETRNGGLVAFDEQGQVRWSVGQDYNDSAKLFSPDDVAVTSTGQIAVLDKIKDRIQFYDSNGRFSRTVDLEKAWGKEPKYPTDIAADAGGGMIVCDFNGSPPISRMRADGSVIAKFHPKFSDGRTFNMFAGVKAAPNGRLWSCDGESLLALNERGVVDRVLGQEPDAGQLGKIVALTVDHQGQIYAVSRRTGAIHVFDRSGRPLHVCQPLPTDFASNLPPTGITVAGDGGVYVGDDMGFTERKAGTYLHFDATGNRVGFETLGLDKFSEEWHFKPGSQERWVTASAELYLVGADAEVIRTIRRRPDRNWLEDLDCLGVAPDGSVAVVAMPDNWYLDKDGDPTINLYTSHGEPIRTFAVPTGDRWISGVAFNGEYVVASLYSQKLLIFTADGSPVGEFTPPGAGPERHAWLPFFPPDGNELWLFACGTRVIQQYAFP